MVLLLRHQPLFLEVTHVVKMKPMPSYRAALGGSGSGGGSGGGSLFSILGILLCSSTVSIPGTGLGGGGGFGTESVSSVFGGGGAVLGGGGSPSVDAIMVDVRRTVLYSA